MHCGIVTPPPLSFTNVMVYIGETQRRRSHYTTMHRFSLIFGIELCESLRDCLSKNCGFLSRFFTLKVLIFGRYVFVIVLFVTLIARFLFYVVVVDHIHRECSTHQVSEIHLHCPGIKVYHFSLEWYTFIPASFFKILLILCEAGPMYGRQTED